MQVTYNPKRYSKPNIKKFDLEIGKEWLPRAGLAHDGTANSSDKCQNCKLLNSCFTIEEANGKNLDSIMLPKVQRVQNVSALLIEHSKPKIGQVMHYIFI